MIDALVPHFNEDLVSCISLEIPFIFDSSSDRHFEDSHESAACNPGTNVGTMPGKGAAGSRVVWFG